MILKEAIRELWGMSERPVHRREMMPEVNRLLQLFENANEPHNGYTSEKIHEVREYFDELGKLGRGHWTMDGARQAVQTSIGKLENLVSADGERLATEGGTLAQAIPELGERSTFGRRQLPLYEHFWHGVWTRCGCL